MLISKIQNKHLRLTNESRGERLTNRCLTADVRTRGFRMKGWRGTAWMDVNHDANEIQMHQRSDALEIDIILNRKPATNAFVYDIKTEGLNFYYQAALTQKEIDDGCHRPDNVVGSYAVYHKTGKNNHKYRNGIEKNYGTGKFCHIYRPQAIDADNNKVWCDLHIDTRVMTITVPQDFLDTAAYPVVIDPTFGNTNIGSSTYYFNSAVNDNPVLLWSNRSSNPNARTLESIDVYTWTYNNPSWPTSNERFKLGVYTAIGESGDPIQDREIYKVAATNPHEYDSYNNPKWYTFSLSGTMAADVKHQIVFQYEQDLISVNAHGRFAYDAGEGDTNYFAYGININNWPDEMTCGSSFGNYFFSIYVTYTEVLPPTDKTWLAKGWTLGNVEIRDNAFQVEIRGKAQHLDQQMIELFSPSCRASLGDSRCGVDLEDSAQTFWHDGSVTEVTSDRKKFIDDNLPSYASEDVFTGGLLTWVDPESGDSFTGNNADYEMEIKKYDPATHEFELFRPMPNDIEVGDEYVVTWGCDKSIDHCKNRFDNIENFRGEPFIPGWDKMMKINRP